MIGFFSDFAMSLVHYEPGVVMEFSGPNRFWKVLAGNLILLPFGLGACFYSFEILNVFEEPGAVGILTGLVGMAILVIIYSNIASARGPRHQKRQLVFRPDGIYYNHTINPEKQKYLPKSKVEQLIFRYEFKTFEVFINGARRPAFTVDIRNTLFLVSPDTFVTFLAIILGWPEVEEMKVKSVRLHRMVFPVKEAVSVNNSGLDQRLANNEVTDLDANSKGPEQATIPLLPESSFSGQYVVAEQMENGWIVIQQSSSARRGKGFSLHPETGEVLVNNLILSDQVYQREDIRKVTIRTREIFVKWEGSLLLGEVILTTRFGDPRILLITLKKRGNGLNQQFDLYGDLRQVKKSLEQVAGL